MVKILCTTALFTFFCGAIIAQQKTNQNDEVLPQKILDNPKVISQRNVKHWADGQRATPTGHQATGIGSGYSSLKAAPMAEIVPANFDAAHATNTALKLDPRKVYNWADGTRSTPSGHTATPVNGTFSALKTHNQPLRTQLADKSNGQRQPLSKMSDLDPRKIYNWADGTSSTPSGHIAAPVNGTFSALKKDEAVKKDLKKNQ